MHSLWGTKIEISENVNKRIGMCENLVLFYLGSSQVEKEKKKVMMDINLRSVAVVTSLGGGHTKRNLCMRFDFPQPLIP